MGARCVDGFCGLGGGGVWFTFERIMHFFLVVVLGFFLGAFDSASFFHFGLDGVFPLQRTVEGAVTCHSIITTQYHTHNTYGTFTGLWLAASTLWRSL